MKKINIYLLGRPSTPQINYLIKNNYNIYAIEDKNEKNEFPKNIKNIFKINLSSKEETIKQISKIPQEQKPDALSTRYENYVLAKTWIGEYFNIKVPSENSIKSATDKYIMREKFMKYDPSITPHFRLVNNFKNIEDFMKKHRFPVILKPTNLFKSLMVTKNENIDELKVNYNKSLKIISDIYKQYGVTHQKPRMIIEEFLDGPSFSIEVFVDSNKNVYTTPITDLVMARDIGISDNYNYSRKLPTKFSLSKQAQIKEVAIKGMLALKLYNSPGHTEIIYTQNGPKIIEIGARIGGYRTRMYESAYGINLEKADIDISLGKKPIIKSTKKKYCAVYEIFPKKEGKFKKISNLKKLESLKSLDYLSIKKKINDKVGLSKNGYKMTAVIMISCKNQKQFKNDCTFIEKKVNVITK